MTIGAVTSIAALSTCPTTTMASLRVRVAVLMAVDAQDICVSVNGKALEDGVTLQEANVHNGSIIVSSLRLRGGVRHATTLTIDCGVHSHFC